MISVDIPRLSCVMLLTWVSKTLSFTNIYRKMSRKIRSEDFSDHFVGLYVPFQKFEN